MPRVSVEESAYLDPRLTAASQLLRLDRERLSWRLIGLWSHVTRTGHSLVRPRVVAGALRKDVDDVVEALVEAELATETEDDALDLEPMRSLFGDYEWYVDLSHETGGKARAATATRDSKGRFEGKYADAILAHLASGPCKRSKLRAAVGGRNSAVRAAVRELLRQGLIVELDDGSLARAPTSADDGRVSADGSRVPGTEPSVPGSQGSGNGSGNGPDDSGNGSVPAGTVPGTVPVPSASSAPAPAPAPAHARGGETRAHARNAGSGERSGTELSGTQPDRYTVLYEAWDRAGRKACDNWRSCGPVAGRTRVYKALADPQLVQRSPGDIQHGLAMLRAECAERERLGHEDPWRWYRNAWSPSMLSAACDIPDERSARARARKDTAKTGSKDEPKPRKFKRLN